MTRNLIRRAKLVVNFGPIFLIDSVRNRLRRWRWASQNTSVTSGSTSLSDGTKYVEVCKAAVENDSVYLKYKSCEDYRQILEHCDYPLGLEYLSQIHTNRLITNSLREISEKDGGLPAKFWYPKLGRISPTHIRYAKVSQDLLTLFGSLDGLRIAEIGVGFGGQAQHVLNLSDIAKYELIDLEWPAKLAMKNLVKFNSDAAKKVQIAPIDIKLVSDLVISNYAFSELARNIQDIYMKGIISNATKGYVIFNYIHEVGSDSMSAEEFLSVLPHDAEVFKEKPLTHPENVLIVWGHSRELPEDLFERII
ncbi:hypothetical protein MCEMRE182_00029 [Candidatus Nanopelagicaceae bacterium]